MSTHPLSIVHEEQKEYLLANLRTTIDHDYQAYMVSTIDYWSSTAGIGQKED